ncbi:coiled-coil domain-containing protein 30 isoform X3 [Hypomesus transpacificus]|uniref:coiled-coil domain-containing protein 30 isoform X3 n=1 Tax=Hypomesus transpacificus TaxID=137520 RepID=UPI001F085C39|nr:coiled-coil domain-containing protein 30 isoform X3 [Hypomesus transpacificus]
MEQQRQEQEELGDVVCWLQEEGLSPTAPVTEQLCFLWREFQQKQGRLLTVTHDLDTLRSRHTAEIAEVQRYLDHIRCLSEQRDGLAQELEKENEQLRSQLEKLTLQQDAQMNEVAEMLYQVGLTEVMPSSPSEQVAYLLVERASLLDREQDPGVNVHAQALAQAHSPKDSPQGTEPQSKQTTKDNTDQRVLSGALHRGLSPWKRLFGLRKAAHNKHCFVPASVQQGQGSGVRVEWARLERDLDEASRRLAMAHQEIRRLTDELESARLTQSAYEPELQGAQQEVEQLRQEVEKLKKCDVVELRKAKELNDRLDQEIRALRTRVRSLDAERRALLHTGEGTASPRISLETALQTQTQDRCPQRAECPEPHQLTEVLQGLQEEHRQLSESKHTLEQEVLELRAQKEKEEGSLEALKDKTEELEEEYEELKSKREEVKNECSYLREEREKLKSKVGDDKKEYGQTLGADVKLLQASQQKCERLTEQLREVLIDLDTHSSKYHEKQGQHKKKLRRAKQTYIYETGWRDQRIKVLERELAFTLDASVREREMTTCILAENNKLLHEQRCLLKQLSEEQEVHNDTVRTASANQCRVDFLEDENRRFQKTTLQMSNQIAALQRTQQNHQSMRNTEELKKTFNLGSALLTSTRSVLPGSDKKNLLDIIQSTRARHPEDTSPSPLSTLTSSLSRPTELGYLNLTSPQTGDDHLGLSDSLSTDSGEV